ncbi:MAG TPA: hypothetical protein VFQ38_14400 [Longimicrobiales bacterium]|nr:hypothetical protein [Longimicrobiales bacterium]
MSLARAEHGALSYYTPALQPVTMDPTSADPALPGTAAPDRVAPARRGRAGSAVRSAD